MKPEELKMRVKGVVNIMPTPFNDDGSINLDGLKRNAKFLVDAFRGKKASIVTCGSTSEFYAMNDEENKLVAKTVIDAVDGAVPVIVGTARAGTDPTIEMSKFAQDIGADGVMVVLPYYHMPSREGLLKHYTRIAESIDIGVMIYNNPTTSKLWIDVDLMEKLSEVPNIVACKENTLDMGQFRGMLKRISPERMSILTGLNEVYYSFLWSQGCPGFISSTISNFAPEIPLEIYRSAQQKDFKTAHALVDKTELFFQLMISMAKRRGPLLTVLSPGIAAIEHPIYISLVKEAMGLVGLAGGKPRGPMEAVTREEVEELREVLKAMDIKLA